MSRTIILIPINHGVGLTSVSLGLLHALEQKGKKLGFMKPVADPRSCEDLLDRGTAIVRTTTNIETVEPLSLAEAEQLVAEGQTDVLMEKIVEKFQGLRQNKDLVIVEGLMPSAKKSYANRVNYAMAQALDADIVFVTAPLGDTAENLRVRVEVIASEFGGKDNPNILGVIVNKVNAPVDENCRTRPDLNEILNGCQRNLNDLELEAAFAKSQIKLLAGIHWKPELIATRAKDLVEHLNASIINEGAINDCRITNIVFCARTLPNMVDHFKDDSLLVTSGDRSDVLMAACVALNNGVKLAGILLTGGFKVDKCTLKACMPIFEQYNLPVFRIEGSSWQTSLSLQHFNLEVPVEDKARIEDIRQYVSQEIPADVVESFASPLQRKERLSPATFRFKLTEAARNAKKRIVLPEGDEPRTVKAAVLCAERGIAECVLLAEPASVQRVAEEEGVQLIDGITVIDPASVAENYVPRLVELRAKKGMTEELAREQLKDTVVLGTMMLEANEVDGLVSGAVHTTANTIRPPMQIIKTAPGSSIISSIFFMLLPDQVLVYGDCAVNPNPSAEQLAEIAIQSADSAKAFGIKPKVAMISYSTGNSGSGESVDKVKEATRIAQEKRPDLLIDGPLQYDAAVMADVAKAKAPNSPVAGQATVFIFPELTTGNALYKAVQRTANLISIGPMLQGMRKPVNDLSRGALVDDIVYTIALTAIQATQN